MSSEVIAASTRPMDVQETIDVRGTPVRPHFTVVIPTHGRPSTLGRCLESLVASDLPGDSEVLVVVNGADDESAAQVRQAAAFDKRFGCIHVSRRTPAGARNAALSQARGEIVYFLDDDVTIAPDLFSRAFAAFSARPQMDVIGGPNLTAPGSGRFERCAGLVLASPFGSGGVRARYYPLGTVRETDDHSLILCNLAVRRNALADLDEPFREHLVCNEENVMLAELARRHRRMLYDPDLIVYHARRRDLVSFFWQIFKYGRGRWQNTELFPSSLSAMFLAPVVFLLYLIGLPMFVTPVGLIPLAAYLTMLLLFSAIEARREGDPRCFAILLVLFPACHIAYPAGLLYQAARSLLARVADPELRSDR